MTNKDAIATTAAIRHLEKTIEEIGGIHSFGSGGMRTISDITVGNSSRFSDPNWTSGFDKFGESGKRAFLSLGEGLKNLYGITEDVGSHIALILGEELGGSVDSARMAVYELGLSFEDLEKAILSSALKGKIRWSEFNVQIAGLADAFKPGLEAVGDFGKGFDNLIASGGRGLPAVKSVLDMAVEAQEAGLKTVDELGARLLAQGKDPEYVRSLIASLKARGINLISEMAGLSQQEAGAVVGGMESGSKKLEESWSKLGASIDDLNKKIDDLNGKDAEAMVRIKADIDPNLIKVLDSGLISNGGSTAAGATGSASSGTVATKSGWRPSTPNTKTTSVAGLNTRAMSAGGISINIDAKGAEAGLEGKILNLLGDLEPRVINQTIDTVVDMARRGLI
jgi:hypothetical protein